MAFNKEQTLAIEASMNIDVLISAGAGSGKTKTLSRRVCSLLESKQIEPSELLILTFTDNAAHEMKERIIKDLKGDKYPRANEMYSAHVQTFDSFSSYLVNKYASRLGIADHIVIANESVIESKRNEFLNDILNEYYQDPVRKETITKVLYKHSMRDDSFIRKNVLSFADQLDKLIPSKRKELLDTYNERYMSREFFNSCVIAFAEGEKEKLATSLYKVFLYVNFPSFIEEPEKHLGELKTFFSQKNNFNLDVKRFDMSLDPDVEAIYKHVIPFFDLEGEDFIKALQEFKTKSEEIFPARTKDKALKELKNLINGDILANTYSIHSDMDEEYSFYLSFKDDINLILDLCKELDKRLFEYKRMSNFFTFADVNVLSLRLLTEDQFSDIAKEVRERFKYIMVDEYQDTNDFQETFIESLLKENENDERSHLFCVGDAKQSIYAFRNSNVALFRARQERYNDGDPSHKVIPMNKNYRSGPGLLKDINYIFDCYMTLAHGSITYLDEMEQLQYDKDVNLYRLPYNDFGVYRIVSSSGIKDDWNASYGRQRAYFQKWEALAIIKDIKEKIAAKHLVYDREIGGTRPCELRDFAILMRTKKGFELYQKLFNEADIPLNNTLATNLKEVDAIIYLQSLLKLIDKMLKGDLRDSNEIKHLFASIARSYAYQYDDQTIYDLISFVDPEGKDNLLAIKDDQIWFELSSFAKENERSSFNEIFLNLLNRFHVIEKLYLIGNVDDNISKIESIHALVLSSEAAGEGLREFIDLLANINKYSLDLSADSIFQSKDAVDMMTIHASKGLERKIVYMPYSFNSLSGQNNLNKPDYLFDERFGLQLTNFDLPEGKETESIYSLPYLLTESSPSLNGSDRDEHVRLFYVALTRAENSIYIVGDSCTSVESDMKKETLYGMLDYCPHYQVFHEGYLEKMLKMGVISNELYSNYLTVLEENKSLGFSLDPTTLGEDAELYKELANTFYFPAVRNSLETAINEIKSVLMDYYINKFKVDSSNIDFVTKVYDYLYTKVNPNSFEEYLAFFNGNKIEEDIDEEDQDEDDEPTFNKKVTAEGLNETLKTFSEAIINKKYDYFGKGKSKADKETKAISLLLPVFAHVYDEIDYLTYVSYKTDKYEDRFTRSYIQMSNNVGKSKLPQLDIPTDERLNDGEISFERKEKKRASKRVCQDDDNPLQEEFEYGTHMHRLLELFDFKNPDLSYIKEPKEREIIEKVFELPLMKKALGADQIFQEYGYFDKKYRTTGFIDLMFIKDRRISIVDYKSSNILDPDYFEQLHVYQRNIQEIFNVSSNDISLYLLSILKGEFIEVPVDEDE